MRSRCHCHVMHATVLRFTRRPPIPKRRDGDCRVFVNHPCSETSAGETSNQFVLNSNELPTQRDIAHALADQST